MKKNALCTAIVFMLLFVAGCSSNNRQAASINNVSNSITSSYRRDSLYSQPEKILNDADSDHLMPEQTLHTNTERSKRITSVVRSMAQIDGASVVVTGTVAIVGIKLNEELPDDDLAKLKEEVRNVVLQTDSGIQNVSVTAAPELSEKITGMAGDNTDGVPASMLNVDLQSILKRVSPTI